MKMQTESLWIVFGIGEGYRPAFFAPAIYTTKLEAQQAAAEINERTKHDWQQRMTEDQWRTDSSMFECYASELDHFLKNFG